AHAAGHAHSLENTAWGGAATNGTRRTVLALGAVRGAEAAEAVALHDTGVPLAFRLSGDVNLFTRLEHVSGDLLTDRVLAGVGGAHLDVVAARGEVVLTQVIAERLVHLARVDVAVAELNRGVPIGLRGTDASHDSWAGLQHRHRHNFAGLVEDLGHAELFAQDSLDLLGRHVFSVLQSLISMSTPAGRSSRMSESTVFGVGSMMSISRLCVRISKCSRESLYLCGDRMTQ